jgi:hypothetical protein
MALGHIMPIRKVAKLEGHDRALDRLNTQPEHHALTEEHSKIEAIIGSRFAHSSMPLSAAQRKVAMPGVLASVKITAIKGDRSRFAIHD